MTDLHLTSSLSTTGALKRAVGENLLSGEVFTTNDIPGIGPLDDGERRMKFLRGLGFEKESVYLWGSGGDAFAPWRQLLSRLQESPVDRLVIWAGLDGNDFVFIRMALHWLAQVPVNVLLVQVPAFMGYYGIGVYSAEMLAPLLSRALLLNAAERSRLAGQYQVIAAHPGLLRECDDDGVLQFRELSFHDDLVLAMCTRRWQGAVRVIGQSMGHSNPRNSLGEAFISSRLKYLIDSGQIEADGPQTSMRTFRVRLAKH